MLSEQRVITCGICFCTMTSPVTLSCKDSFCVRCISDALAQNNDNGFLCPLCAMPHVELSSQTLPSLMDADLQAYIEQLTHGSLNHRVCQWCEEVPATAQCDKCMCIYCDECSAAVHKAAAKRGHVVVLLTEANKNYMTHCKQVGHEEYRAEFYCVQCEQLCCAYCLQIGPHKDHPNMHVSRAAMETRQQMTRDLQQLAQRKARIEADAAELNRVTALYQSSYDSVENMITDRFNQFKQQLLQKELEVRKVLATLRGSGDAMLTSARRQFLLKLNGTNEGLLRFVALQSDGADYEILEGRTMLGSFLNTDTPVVHGGGFKLSAMGDMAITGLEVRLDLHEDAKYGGQAGVVGHLSASARVEEQGEALADSPARLGPLRLSFPVDSDVRLGRTADGVKLTCVARARGGDTQIGVRSRETLANVARAFPEDKGRVTWAVRLDDVKDSFFGVVEKSRRRGEEPRGFYWKPMSPGVVDGDLGQRRLEAVRSLPACEDGDVIVFTFDAARRTLSLSLPHRRVHIGPVLAELNTDIAACFIFCPGESITVLDPQEE